MVKSLHGINVGFVKCSVKGCCNGVEHTVVVRSGTIGFCNSCYKRFFRKHTQEMITD